MAPKVQVVGASLAALLVAGSVQAGETLTVYTYDSFVSEWGPGPGIEEAFEARCGCDLAFVALPGGVDILQRLRLEGQDTAADVVLGLDMNLMAEARALDLLAPHGVDTGALDLPIDWSDDTFLPYDWGHFAFVYDTERLETPPGSFEELLDAPDDVKVILQDPRTSVTGLGLLLWIKKVYGERAPEIWARLNERVLTVTSGWSQAYFSLFMNGEAPMVLSYATSPAYHMAVEGTDRYQAAEFDDGHYLQVETAARVATSEHPALAREFLAFMLTPDFQRHIPLGNVMHPAIDLGDELPEVYERLIAPESLTFTPEAVQAHRREWIREWRNAAAR
ncbi:MULTISPECIES: thiamine ABC transporter substrate binding subunit [unclassified Halomonas]|uniref:thiamine ABC transporter substrate binding subunit n=1 Tax=unclassified Halomonas TaxID=2609666 RepID=UPI00061476B6|nr:MULTISPECIES: thiamine ABC transporter substrate binding subunit [unclassified Halomonas]RAH38597.1 thiamine ABC transporter substrate binding subunit [Halomonas sp. SL1]